MSRDKGSAVLDRCHPQTLEEVRPKPAKASLKKGEDDAGHKRAHGKVLARAIQISGLSQKEAAFALGTDESTLSRWLAAKESQQTWRFERHPQLRKSLLVAMAEDDSGVIVRTSIELVTKKERA